ncbi:hypothetical protein OC834_004773 [Tilletia horrida]|nr:hypothetical protein OC834_004773 [Tilletia horrida]KAK0528167.1 hypothetical protein OC835_004753 [Tilletia horrida]KAK0559072.1 hypothetical protein OC844_004668 [Tilletia horrida]
MCRLEIVHMLCSRCYEPTFKEHRILTACDEDDTCDCEDEYNDTRVGNDLCQGCRCDDD